MSFYKEIGSQYDVVVSNTLFFPYLEFHHPDFIKDYYSVDKHYQYPKEKSVVNAFSRLTGHGLPFSEGENWKRKRNILNKIFNFDFVKSQTYKISEVCSGAI
jgi:cytochrome P450